MNESDIETIELELFLDALHRRYGYDFRHYARASLKRRVHNVLAKTGCQRVSDLIPLILWNAELAHTVISDFSITVTEMFRDPDFYRSVRQSVVPYLETYPFFKIWVAGCATGEEVYSLAILLQEEGLYDRAKIFATDISDVAIKKAQDGIYPLKGIQQYTANYQQAGGKLSFSNYYHAEYGSAIINQPLKANITFANHNLVSDGVFSEVQLIFCRNVLIYFDRVLQNWVLTTLTESLSHGGFLCLGTKEALDFLDVFPQYKVVDANQKIYQKRGV